MRVFIFCCSLLLIAKVSQSQIQNFETSFSGLKQGNDLSESFQKAYLNTQELGLQNAMGPLEVKNKWSRSEISYLIIGFVAGPCSRQLIFSFKPSGELIAHDIVADECDQDGGNPRHEIQSFSRFINSESLQSADPDLIEILHQVEEETEEGDYRNYTFYQYLKLTPEGAIVRFFGKKEVDADRTYKVASEKILSTRDLARLDKKELRLMRNEIFASYGHVFKSKDLKDHFNGQTWYKPAGDATNKLTALERLNVRIIQKAEKQ